MTVLFRIKNAQIFLYISILILLLTTYDGCGQSVNMGVKAGINVASANHTSINKITSLIQAVGSNYKLEPITGFHVGIIFQKNWGKFSLQPEAIYSQYGARIVSGLNSAELKSNVIEIPLLAKYTIRANDLKFFVNGGPFVDYALNGTYAINALVLSFPVKLSQPVEFKDFGERLSYGLSGGVGLNWQLGRGMLSAEVRYSYSLQSKVPSDVILLGGTNVNAKLGMASIAYLIPLGK